MRLLPVALAAALLSAGPAQPLRPDLAESQSAEPQGLSSLRRNLARHFAEACLRKGRVGVRAFSLSTRRVLYDLRGGEIFIPASNVKVLATAAAFYFLKSNFKFKTDVYYTGPLAAGRLSGDLYLKGFGDPSLVSEELWTLVRALKRQGLREVGGDLVVDDTYFDSERFVPGTNGGHGLRPYQAPHGAASLNFNTLGLYVEPSPVVGKPPRAVADPDSPYIQMVNNAKTAGARGKSSLRVRRTSHTAGDLIILEGFLPAGSGPRLIWVNVTEPALYLGHTFRAFLKSEGISVRGPVRRAKTPPHARALAHHLSKPLSIILSDMNKWSNNFIAEQVLKTLGAEVLGAPGTRQKGINVIQRYMRRLGHAPDAYVIADGAGLSRENRLSPAQIVSVLVDMHDDFRFRPEFVSSLAVMGVDGSVRKRLDGTSAEWKIRAKTGTLDGADALSGYAVAADGDVIAFSILMNAGGCPHWKMRELQDRISLEFVRLGRDAAARDKTRRQTR